MPETFIDLQIEGMTCTGCVARVVKALEKIPGARAEVSLIEHRARVTGTDLEAAVAAVRQAGYAASPLAPTRQSPSVGHLQLPDTAKEDGITGGSMQPSWKSVAALFALAIMLVEMAGMALGLGHGLVPLWLQALLASIMQFWVGAPIARRGIKSVLRGRASMETLILLGTATAYFWSMGLWIGPTLLAQFLTNSALALPGSQGALYFEASVVVLAMMHLGERLQDRAQARTRAALAPFLNEAASMALRLGPQQTSLGSVDPQQLSPCPAQDLRAGDRIWLAAGERLPCDGVIAEGSSEFDESSLTGESLPIARGIGDRVMGGTRNISESVMVRVEGNPEEWRQSRLRDQMMTALASRAPIAEWADRVAAVFVPLVAVLAVLNLALQTLWGPGFVTALERTIALLVIACPCALGLATPMALATGLARSAQKGWLFRHAASLQRAAELKRVVFDKTGTLTEGRPRLIALATPTIAPRPVSSDDFPIWLAAAVAAQEGSPHPLAGAFWSFAAGRSLPQLLDRPVILPGLGVQAQTATGLVRVGKPSWVAQHGPTTAPNAITGESAWRAASQIDVSLDGVWQGRVWAQDSLKADAPEALAALRALGLQVAMLSGDREEAVFAMAQSLGLGPENHAWGQSPEDKARILRQWQDGGEKTAMVGDGINDLAAMAQADLAIALSAGASITLKTADVTLTNSRRLMAVAELIQFCKKVRRRIIENLVFAFGFNLLALPLAAAGTLSPALAGAAMALSSVAVVTNALRLLKA